MNWLEIQANMMKKTLENTTKTMTYATKYNHPSYYTTNNNKEEFNVSIEDPENIKVGDSIQFTKCITEEDVKDFSEISGDHNPLHLDDDFAEDTMFGESIVHGSLVASLISAALSKFPQTVVYLSQDLEFTEPVSKGEVLTANCQVVESLEDNKYRIQTKVLNESETVVIDGEAVILLN